MKNCDGCGIPVLEEFCFSGKITMTYNNARYEFLGTEYVKPCYDVELMLCEKCAINVMQSHKGILINAEK